MLLSLVPQVFLLGEMENERDSIVMTAQKPLFTYSLICIYNVILSVAGSSTPENTRCCSLQFSHHTQDQAQQQQALAIVIDRHWDL